MSQGGVVQVIVDADGHLDENADEIIEHLDPPLNTAYLGRAHGLFPKAISLENRARGLLQGQSVPDYRKDPTPDKWIRFANRAFVEQAVLYPTAGLGIGAISSSEVATILARGYNNWAFERYTQYDSRLHCVALLPMQDPDEAVRELQRVKTLGMPGAVLPAFQFDAPLGSKRYWPVYEEAERSDFFLGVHGTGFVRGAELLSGFKRKGLLVHPFCQIGEMTSLMTEGVFEAFPRIKFGFLEAGAGWLLYVMDRLDEWWEDERKRSSLKKSPSQYIRDGNIFVSAEPYEATLPLVVERVGSDHIFCATDFPHESNEEDRIAYVNRWREPTNLKSEDLENIMGNAARRAYSLPKLKDVAWD